MSSRKATILVCGVAVLDFVFRLDDLPRKPEKYRAKAAAIVGGGGAANGAVGIVRLGGEARLAARLGSDVIGDLIVADLVAEGVDCALVRRFEGRQSSYSSIFLDDAGERQIVNFRDLDISFDAGWLKREDCSGVDAVFADTRWPDGAVRAMQLARDLGVPGVIDVEAPASEALDAMALASHSAFSAQGLRDLTGLDDVENALASLGDRHGWVCVTDGENGVWWRKGNESGHVPAFRVEAVDTLGAGDLWHGAFALRLGEGASEIDAVRFANAAAAIKCTRFGGREGTPTRVETENFMKEASPCN